MNKKISSAILIFLASSCLFSCNLQEKILISEKIDTDKNLVISTHGFKRKGEKYKQIDATIRNKEGKPYIRYSITNKCGCLGKSYYKNQGLPVLYEAIDRLGYDIPVDSIDKLIFKKLAAIPGIESYCSKTLLDSAKGFTKLSSK